MLLPLPGRKKGKEVLGQKGMQDKVQNVTASGAEFECLLATETLFCLGK